MTLFTANSWLWTPNESTLIVECPGLGVRATMPSLMANKLVILAVDDIMRSPS
jgi:hypothetical protein